MAKLQISDELTGIITLDKLPDLEAGTLLHDPDGDLMMVIYDNQSETNTVLHVTASDNMMVPYKRAILWGGDITAYFPATVAHRSLKVSNG